MRLDLRKLAKEIKDNGEDFQEAAKKRFLTPYQKGKVREYLGLESDRHKKSIKEFDEEFEEALRAHQEALKQRPPKPVKKVVIHGKTYIDITADLIDCGD